MKTSGEERYMNGTCMKVDERLKVKMWVGMLVSGAMRNESMDVCKTEINRRVEERGKEGWQRGMTMSEN